MQANPTLDQLQLFLAVAEAGSFSSAARRFNRAQSVISYAIANLETQLGLKLFEREGTREPTLTAEGKAMLPDARRMIGVLQDHPRARRGAECRSGGGACRRGRRNIAFARADRRAESF